MAQYTRVQVRVLVCSFTYSLRSKFVAPFDVRGPSSTSILSKLVVWHINLKLSKCWMFSCIRSIGKTTVMKSYMRLNRHSLMSPFENPATVGKIELTKCKFLHHAAQTLEFDARRRKCLFLSSTVEHNFDPQRDGILKRGSRRPGTKFNVVYKIRACLPL